MIPSTEVEMRSSETPIMLSTLSADLVEKVSEKHYYKICHTWQKYYISEIYTHTQQPSKGDGRRQSSKVDKDDSSNDLGVESVCDVTLVVLVASLYVSNHPAKWSTSTNQGVFGWLPRGNGNWVNKV